MPSVLAWNGWHHLAKCVLMAALVVTAAALAQPGAALADSPVAPADQVIACATCHAAETAAWQASTHAKAGIARETCHGPLSADHPAKPGSMKLVVDSTGAQSCHSVTYDQWKTSPHALKGVQCIGCHLAHSQTARLTDQNLCGACHGQVVTEASHGAHAKAGLTCVTCHAASPEASQAPNHSFMVSTNNCINCHATTIHTVVAQTAVQTDQAALVQPSAVLLKQIGAASQPSLPFMAVNFGVGLGFGGLAGVAAMAGFMAIRERRAK
jgi:hypothetical protein